MAVEQKIAQFGDISSGSEELFVSLSDYLSRVFLNIARMAESSSESSAADNLKVIKDVSTSAMLMTEAFTLDSRLKQSLAVPEVRPTNVSSLFVESFYGLRPLAKKYGVELKIDSLPKLSPVMVDRQIMIAAFSCLAQVMLLAQSEEDYEAPIHFAAHTSRHGVVAGVYLENSEITKDAFRRAKAIKNNTGQPFSKLVSGPATGVFLADSLMGSLDFKLHLARYRSMTGLAATLTPCPQLQLV